MARGGRRADRRQSNDSTERVLSNNATAIQAVLGADNYYQPTTSTLFTEIEDNRVFHPSGTLRPPMTVLGVPASFEVSYGPSRPNNSRGVRSPKLFSYLGRPLFVEPSRVILCVRRSRRRSVLHALGKTGRGSGGGRRHITANSKLRCT